MFSEPVRSGGAPFAGGPGRVRAELRPPLPQRDGQVPLPQRAHPHPLPQVGPQRDKVFFLRRWNIDNLRYLGAQTSDRVKQRAVELMYGWRRTMPHLGKISQAYDMLKVSTEGYALPTQSCGLEFSDPGHHPGGSDIHGRRHRITASAPGKCVPT